MHTATVVQCLPALSGGFISIISIKGEQFGKLMKTSVELDEGESLSVVCNGDVWSVATAKKVAA